MRFGATLASLFESAFLKGSFVIKECLDVPVPVKHGENLQRPGVGAVNDDEVGKPGYGLKANGQMSDIASFGAEQWMPGEAAACR